MPVEIPSRPVLHRGLRRLWRDHETLQFGIEPRHAVVVRGVTRADEVVLELLDGSRDVDGVVAAAAERGADEVAVRRLLHALARAQVLDDGSRQPGGNERDRQRLAPDALSLALLDRTPGAAARALGARAAATVAVHGAGRLGSTVVSLLAAAGVGRVDAVDPAPVRAADLAPAGAAEPSADSRAVEAARRAEPAYGQGRVVVSSRATPSLAIVAPTGPMPAPMVVTAVREVPHLIVYVRETSGVVGPLVLPGTTPCWRCVQLARADRDPAWPALAAQLAGTTPAVEPGDVSLVTLTASLAVMQALAWLDGRSAMPTVGGVLELDVADPRLRRRTLMPHPDCGCGASDDQALSFAGLERELSA